MTSFTSTYYCQVRPPGLVCRHQAVRYPQEWQEDDLPGEAEGHRVLAQTGGGSVLLINIIIVRLFIHPLLFQAYRLDTSSSIEVAMVKGGLAPLAYIDEELEEQEGGALGL